MLIQDPIQLTSKDVQKITPAQAWHYKIIPVPEAMQRTEDFFAEEPGISASVAEELEMIIGRTLRFVPLPLDEIRRLLVTYFRVEQANAISNLSYDASSDDFLVQMILEAKNIRSSDIHLEIYEDRCRVRIRIDGLLIERFAIEKDHYPSLVNRIKIMANLDISEKRLPQDGRIFFNHEGQKFDMRVSILPTLHGEKIVMRLLSQDSTNIDINNLGFSDFDLSNYLEGTKRTRGLILISGPTGSGKTTTLYATLKLLNKDTRNILTIEDPIEYTLSGSNQVQLKESIGLNFGSTLRTFLRQDPDIIMVGEIRDPDTANMAIRLSLTGHLVLSTIHTNSAWGTISRLIDMGIPPFLLAETLTSSIAQRLVRLLCVHCKQKHPFNPAQYPKGFKAAHPVEYHYTNVGCEHCHFTGYKGRKAVYEVITIDQELAMCIKNAIFDISEQLTERKIKTLSDNAFSLFSSGDTSLEEIYSLLINF